MTLSFTLTQILREEWKTLRLLQGSKTDSDKETKGYLSGVGWELRNACRAKQQLNIRKTEPSSLSYSPHHHCSLLIYQCNHIRVS